MFALDSVGITYLSDWAILTASMFGKRRFTLFPYVGVKTFCPKESR